MSRRTAVVATVLSLLTSALAVTPAGATPAAADTSVASPAATTKVVHLLTGDTARVRTAPGATPSVFVTTAATTGPAATWSRVGLGNHLYVFPTVVKPYLGRIVDPALFDVTAAAGGNRTAARLDFAAGTRPQVPGFTATSSTATTMTGYIAAEATASFGRSLAAQWQRDGRAHQTPTTLFGASRISAPSTSPPATPAFPQVTLIARVLDPTGAPAPGGVIGLINTDDPRKALRIIFFSKGEARVSLPTGHYSLVTDALAFADDNTYTDAIVTVPDLTLSTTGQVVVLDTRTATVVPTVTTPRPAALGLVELEWDRLVGSQGVLSFAFAAFPGSTVKVAPAPAPRYGQVEWLTHWGLTGTPPGGLPYRYDLAYHDSGAIPADQHRTVATDQLARVDANYYADGLPHAAAFGRSPLYPFQFFVSFYGLNQPAPLARTEYVLAPTDASWLEVYDGGVGDLDFGGTLLVNAGPSVYPQGSRRTVDWLKGPLAPGVPALAEGDTAHYSTACRTDNRMVVALSAGTDTTAGHDSIPNWFTPVGVVASFSLRRGGTVLVDTGNRSGALLGVPTQQSVYTATVSTFLYKLAIGVSTRATTSLTFPSGAGTGAPLPDGWYCAAGQSDARVLPLLTATVPLPTGLDHTMPLGANPFTFSVAPAAGAAAASVTDVHLQTTLDGGRTYVDAPVTALGGNRFSTTLTHGAADTGRAVGIRVSGRTAAGSAITETVDNAYVVQGS